MTATPIRSSSRQTARSGRRAVEGLAAVCPAVARDRQVHRQVQCEIEAALATERFSLTLATRVDLRSGLQIGAEAGLLIRRRLRGTLPHKLVAAVAERSGQAPRLGFWLIRASCHLAFAQHCQVCVPICARQLASGTLRDQVSDVLDETGLPPEQLELAIAEPLLAGLDVETVLALSAIRDLGVGVALDDFGSGLTSLSLLRRLPLTAMKLGEAMVRDLPWDTEHAAIVRAILSSGHALGLRMIAGGVETEGQRDFLARSGCDFAQGPLFGGCSITQR